MGITNRIDVLREKRMNRNEKRRHRREQITKIGIALNGVECRLEFLLQVVEPSGDIVGEMIKNGLGGIELLLGEGADMKRRIERLHSLLPVLPFSLQQVVLVDVTGILLWVGWKGQVYRFQGCELRLALLQLFLQSFDFVIQALLQPILLHCMLQPQVLFRFLQC